MSTWFRVGLHLSAALGVSDGSRWSTSLSALAPATLLLSGFGVYRGRVERGNSWNFWQTPRSLARSVR